jgi:hypothetical protein
MDMKTAMKVRSGFRGCAVLFSLYLNGSRRKFYYRLTKNHNFTIEGLELADDDDIDEDHEDEDSPQIVAARIALLVQGRISLRNRIFRVGNYNGGFVELGPRRRLPTQGADVDPVPSPVGQELMGSGDFGAVGEPHRR